MLNNIIVPGKSLGGIFLGEQVQVVLDKLSETHIAERIGQNVVDIDKMITICHDPENGRIESLACNNKFTGKCLDKLWPGMTVGDVLKNTETQIAWCGFVQVDGVGGVGFPLSDEFDDFERLTDFLSLYCVFDELWVYSF